MYCAPPPSLLVPPSRTHIRRYLPLNFENFNENETFVGYGGGGIVLCLLIYGRERLRCAKQSNVVVTNNGSI
jgi:hypothetical protein